MSTAADYRLSESRSGLLITLARQSAQLSLQGRVIARLEQRVVDIEADRRLVTERLAALENARSVQLVYEAVKAARIERMVGLLTRLDPPKVIEVVERQLKLPPGVIVTRRRDAATALGRSFVYLLLAQNGYSSVEVGRELGGRDHSTVLYGVQAILSRLQVSRRLAKAFDDIRQEIYR